MEVSFSIWSRGMSLMLLSTILKCSTEVRWPSQASRAAVFISASLDQCEICDQSAWILAASVFFWGSISIKYWDDKKRQKIFEIKDNFHIVNSYGSIGCEYFDIALGQRNFAILSRLYPWDHIPGVFIIRIAGGHDCHFDKLEYKFYHNSNNLIVSNSKKLNYEILNLLEGE